MILKMVRVIFLKINMIDVDWRQIVSNMKVFEADLRHIVSK